MMTAMDESWLDTDPLRLVKWGTTALTDLDHSRIFVGMRLLAMRESEIQQADGPDEDAWQMFTMDAASALRLADALREAVGEVERLS